MSPQNTNLKYKLTKHLYLGTEKFDCFHEISLHDNRCSEVLMNYQNHFYLKYTWNKTSIELLLKGITDRESRFSYQLTTHLHSAGLVYT